MCDFAFKADIVNVNLVRIAFNECCTNGAPAFSSHLAGALAFGINEISIAPGLEKQHDDFFVSNGCCVKQGAPLFALVPVHQVEINIGCLEQKTHHFDITAKTSAHEWCFAPNPHSALGAWHVSAWQSRISPLVAKLSLFEHGDNGCKFAPSSNKLMYKEPIWVVS